MGLTYMQARYYDPVLGRFYGNDPVGFTGEVDTFNRYSYVANNPYIYTDPTGEAKYKGDKSGVALTFIIASAVARNSEPGSATQQYAQRVADVAEKSMGGKVHGNSKASTKEQHRYEISEKKTGDVVKTGVSGQELKKDGSSPRADSQVSKLNREAGEEKYEASVKETKIPGREAALKIEQAATNQLNANGHSLERQCKPKPEGSC